MPLTKEEFDKLEIGDLLRYYNHFTKQETLEIVTGPYVNAKGEKVFTIKTIKIIHDEEKAESIGSEGKLGIGNLWAFSLFTKKT